MADDPADDPYGITEADLQAALLAEAGNRRRQMLLTAFGPLIEAALKDDSVIEVMVNPDGKLWIERVDEGRVDMASPMQAAETERIIRLVAAHMRGEVHDGAPIVSAELPDSGERFEGVLPPVAPAPCFAIRKPAGRIFELKDYVDAGIATPLQAKALSEAVVDRKNIVVVGGTSSGKTTLVNALLAEVAESGDRVMILEDTRELQCAAEDVVALRTKPHVASLADLVRSTLRLRPDRIIVGEVRGREALDMLKAWNTGHPGGITTIHANSDRSGLYRLEQLIQEAVVTVPRRLIADAVNVLVFIEGRGAARKIRTVSAVTGLDANGDYRLAPLAPTHLTTV
jgi:P-type conjugative transfer ATPase TrbB